MSVQIIIKRPMMNRRTIIVNGDAVGSVVKIAATETHIQHWSGEVLIKKNTWRINEVTLEDVMTRVKEACNAG